MKIKETRPKTGMETIIVCRTCDICGRKSDRPFDSRNWSNGYYVTDETEISVICKAEKSSGSSDGGSGTSIEVDLCPTCFRDKLIPFLKSQGCQIREEEIDW
jgi:hypothetical protein